MEAPHPEANRDRPPASHRTSAVPEEAAKAQPVRVGDGEGPVMRSSGDTLPKATNGAMPAAPGRSSRPAVAAEHDRPSIPATGVEPGRQSTPAMGAEPGRQSTPAMGAEPGRQSTPAVGAEPGRQSTPAMGAEPGRQSSPAMGVEPGRQSSPAMGAEQDRPSSPATGAEPGRQSSPAEVIEEAPPSAPREVPTPLLASEALMEDLAPMHPARDAARVWCAVVGLSFLLLGGLSFAGLRPGGAAAGPPAFILGFVALVAAFTPVSYRQRAVAMVVLGVIATVIGLRGAGPAVGIDAGGVGWGAARAIAATALPAALVFRSRYRAYAGARWLLVAAFVVALPALGHAVARLVLLDPHLGHLGAVLVILAALASLTGFMGSETTGAGTFLAVAVVLACSVDLLVSELAQMSDFSVPGIVNVLATALAFAATCALTSLGLFQVLAWRLAADARRIDLHSHHKDTDSRDRLHSGGDWLS